MMRKQFTRDSHWVFGWKISSVFFSVGTFIPVWPTFSTYLGQIAWEVLIVQNGDTFSTRHRPTNTFLNGHILLFPSHIYTSQTPLAFFFTRWAHCPWTISFPFYLGTCVFLLYWLIWGHSRAIWLMKFTKITIFSKNFALCGQVLLIFIHVET